MNKTVRTKEIHTDEYSLVYGEEVESFWCSGCNQEKKGQHMIHSIFFKEYTDTEPICMSCIAEYSTL